MFKINQVTTKMTATNKIGDVQVDYSYEVDNDGNVSALTANTNADQPHRVNAHYDPNSQGLHIGIYPVSDEFDGALLTEVYKDVKKILKQNKKS